MLKQSKPIRISHVWLQSISMVILNYPRLLPFSCVCTPHSLCQYHGFVWIIELYITWQRKGRNPKSSADWIFSLHNLGQEICSLFMNTIMCSFFFLPTLGMCNNVYFSFSVCASNDNCNNIHVYRRQSEMCYVL